MAAKNKKVENLSKAEYERLGRMLESIFEGGYVNHHRIYRMNLLRGMFFGLGSVIGGTLVIACILWILTLFSEVPLIGDVTETVRQTIE